MVTMARILVVDDVPDSVRLVAMLLRADKHEVITVESPASAFAILKHHEIDAIIADHNMPGMTGEAFLERVGTLWPHIARLMLTADPRVRNDAGREYPVAYKPFRAAELRAQVAMLLAGRKTV